MQTSTKIIMFIGGLLALLLVVIGGAIALFVPVDVEVNESTGDPAPSEHRLADGDWFGFVSVTGHEADVTFGIDLAEFLTGEAARDAAVAAGEIGAGEHLPNDFYILDVDAQVFEHRLGASPTLRVLDGIQPSIQLDVSGPDLLAMYAGTYTGTPVYGIAPGVPIPMNVRISDGMVVSATSVYLP